MSTRSRIGMLNLDGTISSIYCHHDGYLEGVGETLVKYWNDLNDIIELIANGDISSLGENLDDTKFYNDGSKSIISLSERLYMQEDSDDIEYYYLYKDNRWYFAQPGYHKFCQLILS